MRPRITGTPDGVWACSTIRNGFAIFLFLGGATLGCHVFSPGLSRQDASRFSGPDSASTVSPTLPGEDVSPISVQEPLIGPASVVGCADGSREGFRDLATWPSIAGCAGGWQNAGLPVSGAPPRPCGGIAGNSSRAPDGLLCGSDGACVECGVADLCAPLWRPCVDGKEVMNRARAGCENILPPGEPGFFLAMAGASADGVCAPGEHNDLHGCGNLGTPESGQCPPFTRRMGFADCERTEGVWKCGTSAQYLDEVGVVTKPKPDLGGVLCCKD
jgi:hypothetical protein